MQISLGTKIAKCEHKNAQTPPEHGASMVTYLGEKLPLQPCSNLVDGCGVLTYRPPTMEEPANFDSDYGNKTRNKNISAYYESKLCALM
jgi:hypothetical protein